MRESNAVRKHIRHALIALAALSVASFLAATWTSNGAWTETGVVFAVAAIATLAMGLIEGAWDESD